MLRTFVIALLVVFFGQVFIAPVAAAEFFADTNLRFSQSDSLENAYLAGESVQVDAPVAEDLVVAGSRVEVNGDVEGGVIAAGSELKLSGDIGRSARIAGGDIAINGQVGHDVVVVGSKVVLGSGANVEGDVVFFGGQLEVNGPIAGELFLNCACEVTINSEVGGVQAERVGQLRLGPNARIEGPLNYSSYQQAIVDRQAVINGVTNYTPVESNSFAQQVNNFFFFYGLIASLIFTLGLLILLRRVIDVNVSLLRQNLVMAFGIGLAILLLLPIISGLLLIVSFWAGLAGFLLYGLLLVIGFGLSQLLLGWWLLYWWMGRSGQVYMVDWRAALIGVLAATVLMYVPVLGWFIMFLLLLLALGGMGYGLWQLRAGVE